MKWRLLIVAAASIGAAPAQPNWTSKVSQTPAGAYVLGNPQARVRFVEYLSFTCSHCAKFTGEAAAPIKRDYVSTGNVAVEIRHAVRDQFDFTAALLARCGGPAKFFGNTEAIMARQSIWLADAQLYAARDAEKNAKLPIEAQLKAIAQATGLGAIIKARGVTQPQINVCLSSKVMHKTVLAMTKEAFEERKISGTPHFLINGKTAPYSDSWLGMEPSLRAATTAK